MSGPILTDASACSLLNRGLRRQRRRTLCRFPQGGQPPAVNDAPTAGRLGTRNELDAPAPLGIPPVPGAAPVWFLPRSSGATARGLGSVAWAETGRCAAGVPLPGAVARATR